MDDPRGKAPRIFIGISETVDVCRLIGQGLKELGFPVTVSLTEWDTPILDRSDDDHRVIRYGNRFNFRLNLLREFMWSVPRHDLYIFRGSTFGGSFVKSRWTRPLLTADAWILRRLRKRIAFVATGSDIRDPRGLADELRRLEHPEIASALDADFRGRHLLEWPAYRASAMERYGEVVFAQPDYAQHLTRKYELFWNPIDLGTVEFRVHDNPRPLVVHAPSNSRIKGTGYVLAAVDALRSKGFEFDFQLLSGASNSEVKQWLTRADIALDQFLLPAYGVFAMEAMASGCAVLGLANADVDPHLADSPIVQTQHFEIEANLGRLLENKSERVELAHAGQTWVKEKHDYRTVAASFARTLGLSR
jgi:hypothetical protein